MLELTSQDPCRLDTWQGVSHLHALQHITSSSALHQHRFTGRCPKYLSLTVSLASLANTSPTHSSPSADLRLHVCIIYVDVCVHVLHHTHVCQPRNVSVLWLGFSHCRLQCIVVMGYVSYPFAEGHTVLNAPDLFRPPKTSGTGPG